MTKAHRSTSQKSAKPPKQNRKDASRKDKQGGDTVAPGLVLSVLGKGYFVEVAGEVWTCRVRGRLFVGNEVKRPVVGDSVLVEARNEPTTGVINEILPRESVLVRRFPETGGEQVLAANVDKVIVCLAIQDPPFRHGLVDRYLVTCEALSLLPVLVVNKIDLVPASTAEDIAQEFSSLGYQVILTSVVEGIGIFQLRETITGCRCVFTGPSGAGKSSLVNAIEPSASLLTGEVNTVTGKGRHTTTVSQLFPLAGGYIMDTPGIREFSPWGILTEQLPSLFVEFREFLGCCQFRDCKHDAEPGCAVKEAVQQGRISERRYLSYLQLREETVEPQKYSS